MKRLFAIALSVLMLVVLCIPVFADLAGEPEGTPVEPDAAIEKGTITITNPVEGHSYTVYQILSVEADENFTSFVYRAANAQWSAFLNQTGIKGTYVNVSANGIVSWIENEDPAVNQSNLVAFGKAALAYAKDPANGITADENHRKVAGENDTTLVFEEMPLGYYILDTSIGTVFSIDTSMPDIEFEVKSQIPTIDKEVKEGDEYTKVNDVSIGDVVTFVTTVNAYEGAEKYVIHDKMTDGLTFLGISSVELVRDGAKNTIIASNYTLKTKDTTPALTHEEGTFEISFTDGFLELLQDDDKIVVTYTARLNENAVVNGTGNINETKLSYGDDQETEVSKTTTYTWDIPVFKYTNEKQTVTDEEGNESEETVKVGLEGAEFLLYYTGNLGVNQYAKVNDSGKITGWTSNRSEATTLVSDENGNIRIIGIDAGTYYLKETKAPKGYNLLENDTVVLIITHTENNGTSLVHTLKQDGAEVSTVEIFNGKGTVMPSTGGIGTTIFYAVGGVLVVAAGVLLVAKKRTGSERSE